MNAEQQKPNTFERTSCALLFGAAASVRPDVTPGLAARFGHISRFGMPALRPAA